MLSISKPKEGKDNSRLFKELEQVCKDIKRKSKEKNVDLSKIRIVKKR